MIILVQYTIHNSHSDTQVFHFPHLNLKISFLFLNVFGSYLHLLFVNFKANTSKSFSFYINISIPSTGSSKIIIRLLAYIWNLYMFLLIFTPEIFSSQLKFLLSTSDKMVKEGYSSTTFECLLRFCEFPIHNYLFLLWNIIKFFPFSPIPQILNKKIQCKLSKVFYASRKISDFFFIMFLQVYQNSSTFLILLLSCLLGKTPPWSSINPVKPYSLN